jgi:hypothetical protein
VEAIAIPEEFESVKNLAGNLDCGCAPEEMACQVPYGSALHFGWGGNL